MGELQILASYSFQSLSASAPSSGFLSPSYHTTHTGISPRPPQAQLSLSLNALPPPVLISWGPSPQAADAWPVL